MIYHKDLIHIFGITTLKWSIINTSNNFVEVLKISFFHWDLKCCINHIQQLEIILKIIITMLLVDISWASSCSLVWLVLYFYNAVYFQGWKLPDMMFATRRSLSDACTSIAQQLENVYASIRVSFWTFCIFYPSNKKRAGTYHWLFMEFKI
jgi:hypothetical protein